ncbi:MAG TPA: PadR family transcriptional regulator, partial [Clostridia bacterium]
MAVQNKTRFAILGILALQPSSGYSIKQVCDAGISHFWNENYGHLYPMLRQMTLSGDIKIIESTDAGRRKYIYQITGQGMSALQEWLSQPVDAPPARLELLLKLSF